MNIYKQDLLLPFYNSFPLKPYELINYRSNRQENKTLFLS